MAPTNTHINLTRRLKLGDELTKFILWSGAWSIRDRYSPVTVEQCRQDTAMILFTVMDYDVLTANDFAGEALLSLNTIPGVATIPQSLDTFHGLKQIDLVLMHQPNKRTYII